MNFAPDRRGVGFLTGMMKARRAKADRERQTQKDKLTSEMMKLKMQVLKNEAAKAAENKQKLGILMGQINARQNKAPGGAMEPAPAAGVSGAPPKPTFSSNFNQPTGQPSGQPSQGVVDMMVGPKGQVRDPNAPTVYQDPPMPKLGKDITGSSLQEAMEIKRLGGQDLTPYFKDDESKMRRWQNLVAERSRRKQAGTRDINADASRKIAEEQLNLDIIKEHAPKQLTKMDKGVKYRYWVDGLTLQPIRPGKDVFDLASKKWVPKGRAAVPVDPKVMVQQAGQIGQPKKPSLSLGKKSSLPVDEYLEKIEGVKTLPVESGAKLNMVIGAVERFKRTYDAVLPIQKNKKGETLYDKDGKPMREVDDLLVATMTAKVPGIEARGVPWTKGRQAMKNIYPALDAKIRAESGAAVPPEEFKRLMAYFLPDIWDNDESVRESMDAVAKYITGSVQLFDPNKKYVGETKRLYGFDEKTGDRKELIWIKGSGDMDAYIKGGGENKQTGPQRKTGESIADFLKRTQ